MSQATEKRVLVTPPEESQKKACPDPTSQQLITHFEDTENPPVMEA